MLFNEIIDVYFQNYTKHKYTIYVKYSVSLMLKPVARRVTYVL
jgi:hypothetical protein